VEVFPGLYYPDLRGQLLPRLPELPGGPLREGHGGSRGTEGGGGEHRAAAARDGREGSIRAAAAVSGMASSIASCAPLTESPQGRPGSPCGTKRKVRATPQPRLLVRAAEGGRRGSVWHARLARCLCSLSGAGAARCVGNCFLRVLLRVSPHREPLGTRGVAGVGAALPRPGPTPKPRRPLRFPIFVEQLGRRASLSRCGQSQAQGVGQLAACGPLQCVWVCAHARACGTHAGGGHAVTARDSLSATCCRRWCRTTWAPLFPETACATSLSTMPGKWQKCSGRRMWWMCATCARRSTGCR